MGPPPPPLDARPAADAVDADLAQLAAISSYAQAQAAVSTAQSQLRADDSGLFVAQVGVGAADSRRDVAAAKLTAAKDGLAHLALAAYTGEAYAVPGSGDLSPAGTVTSIGGGTADSAQVAEVLIGVVVDQTVGSYTTAKAVLHGVDEDRARAAATAAAANAEVATATQGVDAAQASLAATTRGAKDAGAATRQASAALPSILGPSVATAPELAGWYATTKYPAHTTVPIVQLAADYLTAGTRTGVRADLAFAQSIIETGYFSFPGGGQLAGSDNNFAGIGACDTCQHGWVFPDALTGITAQMQLLEAYASPTKVPTPLVGPVGVGGCCTTWASLAGTWASNPAYGVEILTLYKQILDWVIPQRLQASGLAAAP